MWFFSLASSSTYTRLWATAFLEKALLTVITAGQPRLPVNHKHPVHTVACVCLCCLQANSLMELLHFGPLCVWKWLRYYRTKQVQQASAVWRKLLGRSTWLLTAQLFFWGVIQIRRSPRVLQDWIHVKAKCVCLTCSLLAAQGPVWFAGPSSQCLLFLTACLFVFPFTGATTSWSH